MRITDYLSFRQQSMSEAKRDITRRGPNRAGLLLGAILTALVFGFFVVSVTSPSLSQAAFSGINGKIAFQTYRDGNSEIYVMNADGSGQTNLSNNSADDGVPDTSPDSSKIAFQAHRDGRPEIYVMNADGSGQTRLTDNPEGNNEPAWSPDGTKIAFTSSRDGNQEIYVMNADGSGQTRLTNNSAIDNTAAWSPDGTKIAFFTSRDGNDEIYIMNSDGSGQANLTNQSGTDNSPAWSPDGSKIAFHTNRDGNFEVYVMNADGSGQTNLSNNGAELDILPDWSPDGTKLVFHSNRDGNDEVYVMNADGSGQTNLTNNSATDGWPDWQVEAQNQPPFDIYLHGTGPDNNPPTLFLDNIVPGAANAKFKDSSGVNFNGGNPWKDIGTWAANPTLSAGTLTTLNELHVWLGLKNSDDQGTKFDLRAEIYKNGTLIASGETYCITNLTRNAAQAKEATVSFGSFSPDSFNGTSDVLALKIQTRIGTDGAGNFCGGHSNAVGLRLYFDATSRPARFNAGFEE